jgi:hypothetical protein
MSIQGKIRTLLAAAALVLLFLLPGCGGNDGGLFDGLNPDTRQFWALNLATGTFYQTTATKVGEGRHCYIYLEAGQAASRSAIDNLVSEFDNRIYPIDTNAFGSEPGPGADGDPKIYILLLEIRQVSSSGSIAGYFSYLNEYPREASVQIFPYSNQKEMIYVDVARQAADDPFVLRTMAHEFQHMIHWEQKDHLRLGLKGSDDVWLNEAMAEAASILCYGPDPGRIAFFGDRAFQASQYPLTLWFNELQDYAKVAMWSQFLIDRYPDNVFRSALQSTQVGASSIESALVGTGKTFSDLFNEWSIANLVASDNALLAPIVALQGHPEWTYRSVVFDNLAYPIAPVRETFELPTFFRFSSIYASFSPSSGNSGQITWQPSGINTSAALIDVGGGILIESLNPGQIYNYTDNAFLVFKNATVTDNLSMFGDNVTVQSLGGGSRPLAQAVSRPLSAPSSAGRKSISSGYRESIGTCGTPIVNERNRWIYERGLRVDF